MDHITTPHGRRSLSLGMVAAQVAARNAEGKFAHKWNTFRAIAECKEALGVTDRALSVLNALLSFLPETAMTAGQLVVFPSNKSLALRAHGMAEATLRRQLASLVEAGLIVRRDSPNGKRYAREGGQAFGLDLSPVLARAEEFERLAAEASAARLACALARERVSLYRRDLSKMIEVGLTLGSEDEWRDIELRFAPLSRRLPRKVTPESVEPLVLALQALVLTASKSLEGLVKSEELNGSALQSDGHLLNSKTDNSIESEPASQRGQEPRSERTLPLALVLKACPDIVMYDKRGIRSWRDLVATAGAVGAMLGISASAWRDAQETLGEEVAATVVAGILQRADDIRSPGGYLRSLTSKGGQQGFSPWPMMLALLRDHSPTVVARPLPGGARSERPGALPVSRDNGGGTLGCGATPPPRVRV